MPTSCVIKRCVYFAALVSVLLPPSGLLYACTYEILSFSGAVNAPIDGGRSPSPSKLVKGHAVAHRLVSVVLPPSCLQHGRTIEILTVSLRLPPTMAMTLPLRRSSMPPVLTAVSIGNPSIVER